MLPIHPRSQEQAAGNTLAAGFKYGLDDKPPPGESLLLGLQWCALVVPFMIILGKIAGASHFTDPAGITVYLQKTAFVMAVFLFLEIMWGHGLPLVMGPSAVLLIGIISSAGFDADAIYTAVASGGVILALAGMSGLVGYLQRLFTPRVVAVVLLLIAFTLMPTVLRLITEVNGGTPQANMVYALSLTAAMLVFHRFLKGIWKSILILLAMFSGSVIYFIIFPGGLDMGPAVSAKFIASFFRDMTGKLSFDAGLLISFFICFVALSINDLGSMQSINALAKAKDMEKRLNRGVFFTGLANIASGIFGIIGQVNYSVSAGVVAATGCISRFTLIPAAAVLLAVGETDARAEQGPAAPDPDKSVCPSAVPEILRTLGYADDFIAEVCGIVLGDSRLRDRINFKIVRDAALLADSEEHRIRAAAAPLDDDFLASFMTDSARRFAEKRVLLGKPGDTPAGGN